MSLVHKFAGAAGGFGKACCVAFAKEGARVVVAGHSAASASKVLVDLPGKFIHMDGRGKTLMEHFLFLLMAQPSFHVFVIGTAHFPCVDGLCMSSQGFL